MYVNSLPGYCQARQKQAIDNDNCGIYSVYDFYNNNNNNNNNNSNNNNNNNTMCRSQIRY